ncbi:MAG TPA: gluconokinase [Steroidobacteraceae bacterium]|nr:gluconokinase [Steroidobacteraceae bacterium]
MSSGLPLLVLMGVSGAGKSTVGALLAERLGSPFLEGDALHPAANVRKMRAGVPLTDIDRRDWLAALAQRLEDAVRTGRGLVVACSALKRAYRDMLREHAPGVLFVHLSGSPALLEERLARRHDHFMPPSLLDSQLATLEPLAPDEHGFSVSIEQRPLEIVEEIVRRTGIS